MSYLYFYVLIGGDTENGWTFHSLSELPPPPPFSGSTKSFPSGGSGGFLKTPGASSGGAPPRAAPPTAMPPARAPSPARPGPPTSAPPRSSSPAAPPARPGPPTGGRLVKKYFNFYNKYLDFYNLDQEHLHQDQVVHREDQEHLHQGQVVHQEDLERLHQDQEDHQEDQEHLHQDQVVLLQDHIKKNKKNNCKFYRIQNISFLIADEVHFVLVILTTLICTTTE